MHEDYSNIYSMPPEADHFLVDVKNEFAQSFEVKDKYLSGWLKPVSYTHLRAHET